MELSQGKLLRNREQGICKKTNRINMLYHRDKFQRVRLAVATPNGN